MMGQGKNVNKTRWTLGFRLWYKIYAIRSLMWLGTGSELPSNEFRSVFDS